MASKRFQTAIADAPHGGKTILISPIFIPKSSTEVIWPGLRPIANEHLSLSATNTPLVRRSRWTNWKSDRIRAGNSEIRDIIVALTHEAARYIVRRSARREIRAERVI